MIRKYVEDYLTFSRRERHAVIGLSLIVVILFVLPKFLPQDKIAVNKKQMFSFAEDKVSPVRETSSADALPAPENLPSRRMPFDPNTLDVDGWISMGVKEKTAHTIQHYLEKGGRFRKADDLLKIYGLPGELAAELVSYVRIAGLKEASEHSSFQKRYGGDYRSSVAEHEARRESFRSGSTWSTGSRKIHSGTVDISTADTAVLITLPGIGSKLAARIVSFREKLGGFYSVEQFREVFGIQDSVYQQLRPILVISPGNLTQININTASEETLKAHPYIRWQLAKLIISYRREHGDFNAPGDLENLQALDNERLKKLIPYMQF